MLTAKVTISKPNTGITETMKLGDLFALDHNGAISIQTAPRDKSLEDAWKTWKTQQSPVIQLFTGFLSSISKNKFKPPNRNNELCKVQCNIALPERRCATINNALTQTITKDADQKRFQDTTFKLLAEEPAPPDDREPMVASPGVSAKEPETGNARQDQPLSKEKTLEILKSLTSLAGADIAGARTRQSNKPHSGTILKIFIYDRERELGIGMEHCNPDKILSVLESLTKHALTFSPEELGLVLKNLIGSLDKDGWYRPDIGKIITDRGGQHPDWKIKHLKQSLKQLDQIFLWTGARSGNRIEIKPALDRIDPVINRNIQTAIQSGKFGSALRSIWEDLLQEIKGRQNEIEAYVYPSEQEKTPKNTDHLGRLEVLAAYQATLRDIEATIRTLPDKFDNFINAF